ncbi:MAG: imidazoleglycerol-phosphate dehydratase HisB [Endomicrobium sp.]|jgi:imidazoleglycerol-phosphate dehydratase|nr:imidazoleglycerol-phosphate dehydratase HisB [Endomicrobium sp.]
MERKFKLTRVTKETKVFINLNIDGKLSNNSLVSTSIGFMDHMLAVLAMYSGMDLVIKASGDTHIDDHHLLEDIGITLGQTLKEALGKKIGIMRYGFFMLPMDEALSYVSLDLSGRFFLDYAVTLFEYGVNIKFNYNLMYDFFYAFAYNAGMNLHIRTLSGRSNHHIMESIFKALGLSLKQATTFYQWKTNNNLPSTKGILS